MSSSAITGPIFTDVSRSPSGSAAAPSWSFNASQGTGVYLVSADVLGLSTAGVQRVVVNASGNVGIGTANPVERLNILTATTGNVTAVRWSDNTSDTGYLGIRSDGGASIWAGGYLAFGAGAGAFTERMRIDPSGNLTMGAPGTGADGLSVNKTGIQFDATSSSYNSFRVFRIGVGQVFNVTSGGALSKASGSFKISHPLPDMEKTHYLVHSFVESPQADNIYRGKVELVNGKAVVNIDQAARMTEGTFAALNRDLQCFTSNESDWDAVRGSVSGNILTIECQNPNSTAIISWLVIGERQDKHMYDTDWTDENGKVITEPKKPEVDMIETALGESN
jgi:hypothetical protein